MHFFILLIKNLCQIVYLRDRCDLIIITDPLLLTFAKCSFEKPLSLCKTYIRLDLFFLHSLHTPFATHFINRFNPTKNTVFVLSHMQCSLITMNFELYFFKGTL